MQKNKTKNKKEKTKQPKKTKTQPTIIHTFIIFPFSRCNEYMN